MGERLTERQRALLQDFVTEKALGVNDWLACSNDEYRTAKSLERRGLLELYGAEPGVWFDAKLTPAGLSALQEREGEG